MLKNNRPPSYAVPVQSYEHLALFAEMGYDPKSFKFAGGRDAGRLQTGVAGKKSHLAAMQPAFMTSPAIQFAPSPSGSKAGSADKRPCSVSSTGDGISLCVDDDPLVEARGSFRGVMLGAFLWLLILAPVFVWQCLKK